MIPKSFLYTNAGGRSYNEDAVGQKLLPGGGLFIVADGLGGHYGSEMASACVVKTFTENELPGPETDGTEYLRTRLAEAGEKVLAMQKEKRSTMKSTAVVLLIRGKEAVWANVGDSRLYFIHDREITQITEDHSVAYKKFMAGRITREDIGKDEDQSALLRALGNVERHEPTFYKAEEEVAPGDAFLLCSDGVWEYVSDGEILVDLLKSDTPAEWAEHLLLRVISRIEPGNDNLSLITVMMQ